MVSEIIFTAHLQVKANQKPNFHWLVRTCMNLEALTIWRLSLYCDHRNFDSRTVISATLRPFPICQPGPTVNPDPSTQTHKSRSSREAYLCTNSPLQKSGCSFSGIEPESNAYKGKSPSRYAITLVSFCSFLLGLITNKAVMDIYVKVCLDRGQGDSQRMSELCTW